MEIWRAKVKSYIFYDHQELGGHKIGDLLDIFVLNDDVAFSHKKPELGLRLCPAYHFEKVEKLYPKDSLVGGELLGEDFKIMPNNEHSVLLAKINLANEVVKMINK